MRIKLARFAVMGNPIEHSLSPFIHHCFAKQTGKQLVYEKELIAESLFETKVMEFFAQEGKGLNITLPFKERAFAMAVVKTARCREAKAANTLWVKEEQLQADNTDGIGLIRDLARYLDLEGKQVLLLGAGGAARGVIGPLLESNIAQLTIANRTKEKAMLLQADFTPIKCCSLMDLQESYDLIINATSASLEGQAIKLPPSVLNAATCCYDLAYCIQGPTPFVAWAQSQHCTAVDGLGMLVEQAAEAFFIWHGVRPETEPVLKALR